MSPQVEIKFPRGDDDPNMVTIMGVQEDVEECKDHLLNLMEEYMQDIVEREDMEAYMHPSKGSNNIFQTDESPSQGGARGGNAPGKVSHNIHTYFPLKITLVLKAQVYN